MMDDTRPENTIILTEADFDRAVSEEMMEVLQRHTDSPMGASVFAMGGAAFARGVWNRLTHEKEN